jgi:hypothetical protein
MATVLAILPHNAGLPALTTDPKVRYPCNSAFISDGGDGTGLFILSGTQEQINAITAQEIVTVVSSDKVEFTKPDYSVATVLSSIRVGVVRLGDVKPLPEKPTDTPGPYDAVDVSGCSLFDPEDVVDVHP